MWGVGHRIEGLGFRLGFRSLYEVSHFLGKNGLGQAPNPRAYD